MRTMRMACTLAGVVLSGVVSGVALAQAPMAPPGRCPLMTGTQLKVSALGAPQGRFSNPVCNLSFSQPLERLAC
jgi:hypothetical protein